VTGYKVTGGKNDQGTKLPVTKWPGDKVTRGQSDRGQSDRGQSDQGTKWSGDKVTGTKWPGTNWKGTKCRVTINYIVWMGFSLLICASRHHAACHCRSACVLYVRFWCAFLLQCTTLNLHIQSGSCVIGHIFYHSSNLPSNVAADSLRHT
jgi:hypothetical protein